MKTIGFILAMMIVSSVAFGQGSPQVAFTLVVPSPPSNLDGNSFSFVGPAIHEPGTIRYQQVYAASEFAYLTNFGGGWIYSAIQFRGDGSIGDQVGLDMPNVRVNLSTTLRRPDELSANFTDNIGTNDTVVFSGHLVTELIGQHNNGNAQGFVFEIHPLVPMFFYNPAAGNLLLDVRVFQGSTFPLGGAQIVFDAVSTTNDSISRVYQTDVFATTGVVDTIGLPTQFYFLFNPKMSVELKTNSVVITWPFSTTYPLPTELQSTKSLAAPITWQPVSVGIVNSNSLSTYVVPSESNGTSTFYRLVTTGP